MAENFRMNAAEDRWEKMNARTEAIFAQIQVKLKILLQRYNCSEISSHGVENSFKEIPNSEPVNSNLLKQDEFIPFVSEVEAPSTCAQDLLVEAVTPVEFPLSTKATKTHFVTNEDFVEQLPTDDSFMEIHGPTPKIELHFTRIISKFLDVQKMEQLREFAGHFDEPPENVVFDGGINRNRGLSLTSQFYSFASDLNSSWKSRERVREPTIKFDEFLDENKVLPVSVFANFDVDITGIQHDSRFVPPDILFSCGDIAILGTYDIAHTTYLTKCVSGMLNYNLSCTHMDNHLNTHLLDSITQLSSVFNRQLPKPPHVTCVIVAYPPPQPKPPDKVVVSTMLLVQSLKLSERVVVPLSPFEPPILMMTLRPPAKLPYCSCHIENAAWMVYLILVAIQMIILPQSNVMKLAYMCLPVKTKIITQHQLVEQLPKLICTSIKDLTAGNVEKHKWSMALHLLKVLLSINFAFTFGIGSTEGGTLNLFPTYFKPDFLDKPLMEGGLFLVKQTILETFANTWHFFHHKFTSLWGDHEAVVFEANLPTVYDNPKVQQNYIMDFFHGSLDIALPIMMVRINGVTYVEAFESIVYLDTHDILELSEGLPRLPSIHQLAIEWLFRFDDIAVVVLQKFYIIFGDGKHFHIVLEAYAATLLYNYLEFWYIKVVILSVLALPPYCFYVWCGLVNMGYKPVTMLRDCEVVIWSVVLLECNSVKQLEESIAKNFIELEQTGLSTHLVILLLAILNTCTWDPGGNGYFFYTEWSLQFHQWDRGGCSLVHWKVI